MNKLLSYIHHPILITMTLLSIISSTIHATAVQQRILTSKEQEDAKKAAYEKIKRARRDAWAQPLRVVIGDMARIAEKARNDAQSACDDLKPVDNGDEDYYVKLYRYEDTVAYQYKMNYEKEILTSSSLAIEEAILQDVTLSDKLKKDINGANIEDDILTQEAQAYRRKIIESYKEEARRVNAPYLTPVPVRMLNRSSRYLNSVASSLVKPKDDIAEYYETVLNAIITRCNKNVTSLKGWHDGTEIEIDSLCGKYTKQKKEKSITDQKDLQLLTPDGHWGYRRNDSSKDISFYDDIKLKISTKNEQENALRICLQQSEMITKQIAKLNLTTPPGVDITKLASAYIEAEVNASANVKAETIKAQTSAEQSGKNLEQVLKLVQNPKSWATIGTAVVGVTGGVLLMYHGIPRLINKTPSIISEKSFLTLYDKLTGKKLPPSNFDQIVFTDEVGPQIMRVVSHLRHVLDKGGELMNLIFFGPPGTGKTMTAKALARSVGIDYMLINAAAFEQLTPGQAVNELEQTFRIVRNNKKPVLMFLDEADAILSRRGSSMQTQTSLRVINTILSNIPDTHSRTFMLVVATNRPDDLDNAILSRLPESGWFYFGPPSAKGRAEILQKYLTQFCAENNVQISEDVTANMNNYAAELKTATGRDLRAVARNISDRMIDQKDNILTDEIVRGTLKDIAANKKHMQTYAYAALNTTA
jgi:AAA+ superfamily predicted ATPase